MAGKNRGYDRNHTGVIRAVRFFALLAVLLALCFTLLLGAALLGDAGMEPGYGEGRPVLYLRPGEVRRGDLVLLRLEGSGTVLRRVVAAAGDTVEVSNGVVTLNGLSERGSYNITRTDAREGGPAYPLLLRRGEYFVLGDKRESALDSRAFGVITREQILGRLLF